MDAKALLGSINLFDSLAEEDLDALAQKLRVIRFPTGLAIFEQGEPGDTLFLIQEGSVDIFHGTGKHVARLATLVPGQYFGELSLFDGEPRSATARAARDCSLLALARTDFVAFSAKHPEAVLPIMAELAQRLRHTNAAFSSQVSRNVLKDEEEKLPLGARVADRVASFGGSWTFIGSFGLLMALWMLANSVFTPSYDPFPFILLNLMLSTLAALQAPVIMMSQNRQTIKDKLLAENDYQVNLKSELGIQSLLKGQAELIARLTLLEKHVSTPSKRPPSA